MANKNPRTEFLRKGGGRKSKGVKRKQYNLSIDEPLIPIIEKIAATYDCFWGGKPWLGGLINKIARGELLVVPAPPQSKRKY